MRLFRWSQERLTVRWLVVAGLVLSAVSVGYALFARSHCAACADARRLIAAGDFAAAVTLLDSVRHRELENAEVAYLYAVALRRAGKLDVVERYLRRATALGWPDAQVELQRCLMVAQSGRQTDVERRLQEIMQFGVEDDAAEQIYEAIAKGKIAGFRLREALECLNYWLEWRPEATQARLWRADVYQRLRRAESALGDYRAVLKLEPAHYEARFRLGIALLEVNDVLAAHEQLQQCLRATPSSPAVLAALAQSARRQGLLAEAIEYAQAALDEKPGGREQVDALMELGQAKLTSGETEGAMAALSAAIKLDPGAIAAHYGLARAYALLGNKEAAELHQANATRASSENAQVRDITYALVDSPENPDLRCDMGAILLEQGHTQEAERWFRSALLVDPNHARARQLLAALASASPAAAPSESRQPLLLQPLPSREPD